MTDGEYNALIAVLKTYVSIEEVSLEWNDDLICASLQILFNENVLTPIELSLELQRDFGVYISPRTLIKAENGCIIRIHKGGLQNV